MLTISGKALGRKKPLFEDFSVPPPSDLEDGGQTTVRDLIECVVHHEVEAFRKRQTDRQTIRVLTVRQIDVGAEAGKIEAGGSEIEPQDIDAEQAVATAIEAFQDGLFLVVIDDNDYRDIDAQVFLQPDSQLTFVRLTLLAGG